jgi:spore coat protein A, manganese oxidase
MDIGTQRIGRRQALKLGALAGGALLLPIGLQERSYAGNAGSPVTKPFTLNFKRLPVMQPVKSTNNPGSSAGQDFTGTDYYVVTQKPGSQVIIPGYTSNVWGYNGVFPGQTIKQRKGRQAVVRHINNLPTGESFTVHLHGMASLPQYDGYAEDLTAPGSYKDYYYPNDRAATLWYHDHAIGKTAFHVYQGLAAFYLVEDDYELSLPLPKGDRDVTLFLHDKAFDQAGQPVFDDHGQTHIMGDVITINGVAWPKMKVAQGRYRFRMVNGSISRSYNLALSTGDPIYVIGTDAGLKEKAAGVTEFRIGMAERYEFIIDFSKYKSGTQIVLQNLKLPIDINYDNTDVVMRFDVDSSLNSASPQESDPTRLTNILAGNEVIRPVTPIQDLISKVTRTRTWQFARNNGEWTLNGKVWDKDRVDANPGLGDYEIWEIENTGGGWFHPVHIHLLDQQIIDRNGNPPFEYEKGWKDVFYAGPNEKVRVVGRYGPHPGRYMMHCHNTVHEDFDMMTQFEVGQGGDDPINAAPPKLIPKGISDPKKYDPPFPV